MSDAPSLAAIERVFREESGVVLAALIARFRDFDLAEDALQDAFTLAVQRWPLAGLPRNPAAWLTTTARNRIIDRLRHREMAGGKAADVRSAELDRRHAEPGGGEDWMEPVRDERLRLIFTCCHPALSREAQVALTLRTLGGLTTGEVARAFLVSEATMGRRLVRAKKKIRDANIPYRVPPSEQLPARLDPVLAVLYLIFNEGYAAHSGDAPVRRELAAEAIRLTRVLAGLLPGHPEVLGLLALMLLHDSRRDARVAADGSLVPLEEQDRSLWNEAQIEEGLSKLREAQAAGPAGPYAIQAAISAVHASSLRTGRIDWATIVALYDDLAGLFPSPVIGLNRAVALSRVNGAQAGLEDLEAIVSEPGSLRVLEDYQPYWAARADLLARVGDGDGAEAAYARAIEMTGIPAERAFLSRRLAALRR